MKEPWIRSVADAFEQVAAALGMQIAGGHCEVSAYVKKPVVTVTAYGFRTQKPEMADKRTLFHQDIVMTKEMAQEGTGLMAILQRDRLLERFSSHYIDRAAESIRRISVTAEAAVGWENHVCAMHDLSETGVFGGLWELGEKLGCGLEVSLKKIPVRQETIELTEYFGINPYDMPSAGSMLMIVENGELLVEKLKGEGIAAAVIGRLTKSHDRVILGLNEQRFLNQPR
jgi:hydrogenase maturation factor